MLSLSLKQRVTRGSSEESPAPHCFSNHPASYKQWGENRMMRAVNSVVRDHLSVRRAAIEFDVPISTLGDRISGRVQLVNSMYVGYMHLCLYVPTTY